ncbi:BSD domain-containing protein 1-A-like [Gossypium australe]|uniref:BSD domain-containing protein 1-A-like n=1 Tax=Gossypium australe TaxID=47621 RepID=A0A5B6W5W8_9ROSI|nr:BSD domain-containing protein 1-A-like [Gossypium australe]
MKQIANRKSSNTTFIVGDLVYLKLYPYRKLTGRKLRNLKLSIKYFRPFPMEVKIGSISYKLALLAGSKMHHTFHAATSYTLPLVGTNGALSKEPVRVFDRMMVKNGDHNATRC